MKKRVIFTAMAVLFTTGFAAFAQKITFDYRFNVLNDDGMHYFTWTQDGKTVKDSYDAVTGASREKSTSMFKWRDENRKKMIPTGLRGLMLYAVSSRERAGYEAFTLNADGKMLTINFIHNANAYKITTDAKGNLSTESSFQIAPACDNIGGKYMLKPEYVKAGGDRADMNNVDWSKIPFAKDVAESEEIVYTGTLKTSYKNGILTAKGTLQPKK